MTSSLTVISYKEQSLLLKARVSSQNKAPSVFKCLFVKCLELIDWNCALYCGQSDNCILSCIEECKMIAYMNLSD